MKRLVLTALLLCPLPAAAQTPYKCGMAVLRDGRGCRRDVRRPNDDTRENETG